MDTHKSRKEKPQQEQEEDRQQQNANAKRKRKEVFPFGNYRNYYGYRIGHDMEEDPRLKVLKKEWFEGKDCLDIGCNSGVLTIHIAKKFHCQSIIGIDIDSNRIEDAYWHLRKFAKLESVANAHAKKPRFEPVDKENGSEYNVSLSANKETTDTSTDCSSSQEKNLLQTVSFQQENFVKSRHSAKKSYDTILCLSVTKWIHLNWGDDGLITLFTKIWKLLHPGGILVLEPQPWKSYGNNRRVSETTASNYQKIIFRPEYFLEILLDKVGFRTVEDLTSNLSGTKTGFNRSIFAFRK